MENIENLTIADEGKVKVIPVSELKDMMNGSSDKEDAVSPKSELETRVEDAENRITSAEDNIQRHDATFSSTFNRLASIENEVSNTNAKFTQVTSNLSSSLNSAKVEIKTISGTTDQLKIADANLEAQLQEESSKLTEAMAAAKAESDKALADSVSAQAQINKGLTENQESTKVALANAVVSQAKVNKELTDANAATNSALAESVEAQNAVNQNLSNAIAENDSTDANQSHSISALEEEAAANKNVDLAQTKSIEGNTKAICQNITDIGNVEKVNKKQAAQISLSFKNHKALADEVISLSKKHTERINLANARIDNAFTAVGAANYYIDEVKATLDKNAEEDFNRQQAQAIVDVDQDIRSSKIEHSVADNARHIGYVVSDLRDNFKSDLKRDDSIRIMLDRLNVLEKRTSLKNKIVYSLGLVATTVAITVTIVGCLFF